MFYLEYPIGEVCILEDYRFERDIVENCNKLILTVSIIDKVHEERLLKGVSIPSMNFITIPSKKEWRIMIKVLDIESAGSLSLEELNKIQRKTINTNT